MKKTLVLLSMMFAMMMGANAQQRFGSKQNNQEIETWKYVADNHKKDHQEWARAVCQEFGLSDEGAIRHAFVINARDSFDIKMMMGLTRMWFDKAFTTLGDTITEYDVDKHIIKANVTLLGMGDAYGFGGFAATSSEAHVTIPLEITIQFKENRLRYETKVSTFILNSSDWVKDVVNKPFAVKDCYPVNLKSAHKDSYSRAFINCHAKCLTSCRDLVNYYNTHFSEKPNLENKAKQKAEDDW